MPADIFADPSKVPSLDGIDPEVQQGLPAEADRMECALIAEDYYQGRGKKYLKPREGEDQQDFEAKPKRTSKLTRKVVRLLSGQLYGSSPTREVEGASSVGTWYEEVAADCSLDVTLRAAVASSVLSHVAAIEIEATGDPDRPIRLWLWKANEFAAFFKDDDPTCPYAVVTRSIVSAGPNKVRARYRMWTAMERRTYYTDAFDKGQSPGGRAANIADAESSGPSPYPSVLPFVFVRNEPAVTEFWEGGIGHALVELNADADRSLTALAEHMDEFLNPKGFARNLSNSTQFHERVGEFKHLKSDSSKRAGDSNSDPEVFYLQAQLGVEAGWLDLKNAIDQGLEELDVPAELIRSSDSSMDLSGVAIVAKRVPFYEGARARQPLATQAETELFGKVCAVAGIYYGDNALLAAARDPKLLITWPEPKIPLPTTERDTADDWELQAGLTDPIEVLARRRGVTLAQAEEIAEGIAERRKRWNSLMGGVMPEPGSGAPGAPMADPNADPEAEGPDDEDPPTDEDES